MNVQKKEESSSRRIPPQNVEIEGEGGGKRRAGSTLRKINISIREVQRNRPFIYVGPYGGGAPAANLFLLPFPTRGKVYSRNLGVYLTVGDLRKDGGISVSRKQHKSKNKEEKNERARKREIDPHAPDFRLPPAGKFDLTPFSLHPSDVLRCLRNRAL